MDWADTAEQATFRQEVHDFIEGNLPEYYKNIANKGGELGHEGGWQHDRVLGSPEAKAAATEWEQAVASRNWVAPHWPSEYGGASMTPMEQFILKQEMSRALAPDVGGQGVSMLGPTLIAHGTDEQKAKFLSATLANEIAWAQGYSEPSAGSDLASLQTRAVRDGDEFVINGQKIWTSNAHRADWIFALVRTNPDAPKHRGISFMLMDMKTPGIEVRPLVSGAWQHFSNETFYEDVRVPVSQVVGEIDRGWYVGMTLLDYERSNISGAVASRRELDDVIEYAHTDEGGCEVADAAVGAGRARRPLRRDRGGVQLRVPHHLDAGGGRDSQLRGVDVEDVRLGAGPAHRAHGDQDVRAVLEPLGPGSGAHAVRRALHPELLPPDPEHDRRWQF